MAGPLEGSACSSSGAWPPPHSAAAAAGAGDCCMLLAAQHHQHQQQQGALVCLPDHVVELIAAHLLPGSGSRDAFRRSCKACRAAAARLTRSLDLYELCGWGSHASSGGGSACGGSGVPASALHAAARHRNATALVLPSGWRHGQMAALLRHAAAGRAWAQLAGLSLHFQALSPAAGAALGELAPQLTQVTLTLDLAFERTTKQAWRIAALGQLPNLSSLVLAGPDLRPEAMAVLGRLAGLTQLLLLGPRHASHPAASLQALGQLRQLRSLRFNWQAGRSLSDARQLAALSNLCELHVWLGAGHEFPPCSSKPLAGLLEALGQLSGLTRLQLLQGLYMSWDLRQVAHLSSLQQLQVLSLHDSVVCEEELGLLAPCTALHTLMVDSLRLPAVRVPAAAAAADGAAAGGDAAAGAAADGGDDELGAPLAAALTVLARLRGLSVNMLQLGLWRLADVAPRLQRLTPLAATLGAKGHGVVWDLGALHGHPTLHVLGLMLGALGTSCSCSGALLRGGGGSAESLAAAVVRMILQSTGIARAGGGALRGCSVQQLAGVLASLPALRELELWGHAGGPSGKLLASVRAPPRRSSSGGGCASPACSGSGAGASGAGASAAAVFSALSGGSCSGAVRTGSSSSSSAGAGNGSIAGVRRCRSTSGLAGLLSAAADSAGAAAGSGSGDSSSSGYTAGAVGNLLSNVSSLLSPRRRPRMSEPTLLFTAHSSSQLLLGPGPLASAALPPPPLLPLACGGSSSHRALAGIARHSNGGSSTSGGGGDAAVRPVAGCGGSSSSSGSACQGGRAHKGMSLPARAGYPAVAPLLDDADDVLGATCSSGAGGRDQGLCSQQQDQQQQQQQAAAVARSSGGLLSSTGCCNLAAVVSGSSDASSHEHGVSGNASRQQPHWQQSQWQAAVAEQQCACSSTDCRLLAQLLQGLPRLQLLRLYRCAHLPQGGRLLAAQCCGRFSGAAVAAAVDDLQ